jgi:ABC-type multidrug transport system ATPase subunit
MSLGRCIVMISFIVTERVGYVQGDFAFLGRLEANENSRNMNSLVMNQTAENYDYCQFVELSLVV